MPEQFNPYRKWLGISGDAPPNHYRLLGLDLFESDPEVIGTAADGRMAQVKQFATGSRAELSQQLLNEIAAARLCLLDLAKKKPYDAKLKAELDAADAATSETGPSAARAASEGASVIPNLDVNGETTARATASPRTARTTRGRKKSSPMVPVMILLVLAAGGLILLLAMRTGALSGGGKGDAVARHDDSADLDDDSEYVPPLIIPDQEHPGPGNGFELPDDSPLSGGPDSELPDSAVGKGRDPSRSLGDLMDDTSEETEPAESTDDTDDPDATADGPPDRLPVPTEEEQQSVQEQIDQLFADELRGATAPADKAPVAKRMIELAQSTADDPIARFVLLRKGTELAAEIGLLSVALNAVDTMTAQYQVNPWQAKLHVAEKAANKAPLSALPSGTSVDELVELPRLLAEDAAAADKYPAADAFLNAAIAAARRADRTDRVRELVARSREIEKDGRRYAKVEQALATIEDNPDDPEANTTVADWRIFLRGDWEAGLPYLARGSDEELARLAKLELAGPDPGAAELELAKGWLKAAESTPDEGRTKRLTAHARQWFEQSLTNLTGLDRIEAEKHLSDLQPPNELDPETPEEPEEEVEAVVKPGNVALASNGTKVKGPSKADLLIDGDSKDYAPGVGTTFSKANVDWLIEFPRTYSLREIRYLLWDFEPRAYNYKILVSADGKEFDLLVDRSQGIWAGWQRHVFAPRPVKVVKIVPIRKTFPGTKGSTPELNMVEFEAYCIPPTGLGRGP